VCITRRVTCLLALNVVLSASLIGAEPASPVFPNPFKPTKPTAEVEIYSGGITGDRIGAGFHSITRGDYGVRFTFGFLKALNFSIGYMYSNQTRTLEATTPAAGGLPAGTALVRAANLNIVYGNGEINLFHSKHAIFYLSPGVGFARNGARNLSLVTPLGVASAPMGPGTSVTFNLGTGVKIYPRKHLGFRIDVRDFVSGGGTGNLTPSGATCATQAALCTAQQYFGPVPVNNNLVLTLGLIFKIL
jgi:hypothetical protein